jgi:hypothetical protein
MVIPSGQAGGEDNSVGKKRKTEERIQERKKGGAYD